jgi:hypothetical protein
MDITSPPVGYGLVSESASISDSDVKAMAAALGTQFARDFCPAYGIGALPVKAFGADELLPDGYWYLHFVDNVADGDALGYHTDENGVIYADIEVAVILKYGCGVLSTPVGAESPDSVSSVASHELLEMAADPRVDLWAPTVLPTSGVAQALEVADPVQESYSMIDGVQVSDFVLPAYWLTQPPPGSKFDFLGVLSAPFTVAPGGYRVIRGADGVSKQVYASRPPSPLRQAMGRRRAIRLRAAAK